MAEHGGAQMRMGIAVAPGAFVMIVAAAGLATRPMAESPSTSPTNGELAAR